MAYSSNSDLLKRFTSEELAKLTGDETGSTIDTDRTDAARDIADASIDAYLHGSYDVPFDSPDDIIKNISIDLTIYQLYKMEYGELPLPNEVKAAYESSLQLLEDLKSGELYLPDSTAGLDAPPSIIHKQSGDNRIYNDDVMDDYFGGGDV